MKFRSSALASLMVLVCVLSACGGGGSSGASDTAEASKQKTPTATTTLTVTTPAQNATVSSTFNIKGTAGTEWVNIAIYNSAGTKVGGDITPSGGAWSTSVNMGSLSGAQTLSVTAFSVAAGQSGGTSKTVTLSVTVGGAVTASVSQPVSGIQFYGVNAHYNEGGIYATNVAQQVKDMQAMGIKTVRQDCYSTTDTATLAGLIPSFSPIVIEPIFDVYPTTTDETTAYNQFYAYGVTVAQQLAGKVPVIEMMNEPEVQYFSTAPGGNGQLVTNWSVSNSQWPAFRGAVRGFYAGFRSVDTTKKTLITSPSVTWLHYGILLGLWSGQGPDGSTGNATATWDITNQHWYYNFGDIETAGGVNTLSVLKSSFNLPIILSEVGANTSISASTYDSYVSAGVVEYAKAAATYNIVGVDWYMLYTSSESPDMGLYTSPGVVNAGRVAAMTAAIINNVAP